MRVELLGDFTRVGRAFVKIEKHVVFSIRSSKCGKRESERERERECVRGEREREREKRESV